MILEGLKATKASISKLPDSVAIRGVIIERLDNTINLVSTEGK